jgi:hypothetical protein
MAFNWQDALIPFIAIITMTMIFSTYFAAIPIHSSSIDTNNSLATGLGVSEKDVNIILNTTKQIDNPPQLEPFTVTNLTGQIAELGNFFLDSITAFFSFSINLLSWSGNIVDKIFPPNAEFYPFGLLGAAFKIILWLIEIVGIMYILGTLLFYSRGLIQAGLQFAGSVVGGIASAAAIFLGLR